MVYENAMFCECGGEFVLSVSNMLVKLGEYRKPVRVSKYVCHGCEKKLYTDIKGEDWDFEITEDMPKIATK